MREALPRPSRLSFVASEQFTFPRDFSRDGAPAKTQRGDPRGRWNPARHACGGHEPRVKCRRSRKLGTEGGMHARYIRVSFRNRAGVRRSSWAGIRVPWDCPGIALVRSRPRSDRVVFPRARSYVGTAEFRKVDRDLDPLAPTLFELSSSNVAALSVIGRGLRPRDREGHTLPFALRAARVHFSGNVRGTGSPSTATSAPAWPIAFARNARRSRSARSRESTKLPTPQGHDAPVVRDAPALRVDETAARIRDDAERDGRWDSMPAFVDRERSRPLAGALAHEDLAGLIQPRGNSA